MYEFYPDLPAEVGGAEPEPVLAFPAFTHRSSQAELTPYQVSPGRLSVTELGTAAAAAQVNALIDECAEFSTPPTVPVSVRDRW